MDFSRLLKFLAGLLVVALLLPSVMMAADGKIRGFVTDAETGEPLLGANVQVVGTNRGTATDENGEYVILNIPTGMYDVVATYMGYQQVTVEEVIVSAGLSTYRDVAMPKTVIEGQEVVIVAERPLVNKNATNFVRTVRAEDLENLPIRTVNSVVAAQAGAIMVGNDLHVRGGRSHENARYVDGVFTTCVRTGGEAVNIVDRAIEEISYQAGGMNAEYGFANSGAVNTTIKTGGTKYSLSLEAISDDFWAFKDDEEGYRILGIPKLYSYGYDDYFLTAGGPIAPGLKEDVRFFVAAQHYWRGSNATWFEGWQQDSLWINRTWTLDSGTSWESEYSDSVNLYANIPPGRIPGGGELGDNAVANIVWNRKSFSVKLGGTFHRDTFRDRPNGDPFEFFDISTNPHLEKTNNYTGYLRFTHTLNPTTFYTLNLNYFGFNYERGDNVFWDDIRGISDPAVNPAMVDTSVTKTFMHPLGIAFNSPDFPYLIYEKQNQNYMGVKLDLTKQWGVHHEFKLGGEFNYYTLRRYQISTQGMLQSFVNQEESRGTATEISDYSAYRSFLRNYGYDIYGDKIDADQTYEVNVGGQMVSFDGKDAPPHPLFGGAYLQDKVELRDMVLNLGLRFDYFYTGSDRLKDLRNIQVANTGFIAEESFEDPAAYMYVSPRLGFSFPVTDKTVFHAQYGKYVQLPPLIDVFESWGYFAHSLFSGGYARQYPNPNLRPERETQYEFGFAQQFGDNASLDITAFYKETKDLVAIRTVIPEVGTNYKAPWISTNQDFATTRGLSATFQLRRTNRVAGSVNYTLAFSSGTGSESGSHFDIAWTEDNPVYPTVIMPLDYDSRHKLVASVDIRSNAEDGPQWLGGYPLGKLGLSLMMTARSGFPYTRIEAGSGYSEVFGYTVGSPLESSNASNMPWVVLVNGKLDKTFNAGPVDVNVYLWAMNLLNTKNVRDVWWQTGRPDTDGHVQSEDGRKRASEFMLTEHPEWTEAQRVAEYEKWYNALLTNCGTWGWFAPRQLRFGIKVML
jgi:outer membrane receptor protein involved in Fe transport